MYTWDRLKCLSVISTYFHVALGVVGSFVFMTILAMVCDHEDVASVAVKDYEDNRTIILCYFVALLLYFLCMLAFSIVLIVGISRKQPKLMAPFVYLVYGGTWMYAFLSFRHFVWGLWHRGPFAKLFIKLIVNLSCVSIQAAIFWPVYLLYRQWHNELREELKQQDTDTATKSKSGGISSLEKY